MSRGSQEKVRDKSHQQAVRQREATFTVQCLAGEVDFLVHWRGPVGHYSGQYYGWHDNHRRNSSFRWLYVNTVFTGGQPVEFVLWCEGTSPALLSANLCGSYQEIWILGRLALFILFIGSVKPVIFYNIAWLWLLIYSFFFCFTFILLTYCLCRMRHNNLQNNIFTFWFLMKFTWKRFIQTVHVYRHTFPTLFIPMYTRAILYCRRLIPLYKPCHLYQFLLCSSASIRQYSWGDWRISCSWGIPRGSSNMRRGPEILQASAHRHPANLTNL